MSHCLLVYASPEDPISSDAFLWAETVLKAGHSLTVAFVGLGVVHLHHSQFEPAWSELQKNYLKKSAWLVCRSSAERYRLLQAKHAFSSEPEKWISHLEGRFEISSLQEITLKVLNSRIVKQV